MYSKDQERALRFGIRIWIRPVDRRRILLLHTQNPSSAERIFWHPIFVDKSGGMVLYMIPTQADGLIATGQTYWPDFSSEVQIMTDR